MPQANILITKVTWRGGKVLNCVDLTDDAIPSCIIIHRHVTCVRPSVFFSALPSIRQLTCGRPIVLPSLSPPTLAKFVVIIAHVSMAYDITII